jgi:hypothetical protein
MTTSQAIKRELTAAFPGVKFSVTTEDGAIDIRWTGGPDKLAVKAIGDTYKTGYFDAQSECYIATNARTDIPTVDYIWYGRHA